MMWETKYTAETDANPAVVWEAFRTLCLGSFLGVDSDAVILHGPFAVGSHVTVTPQGQDPVRSIIIELEPGSVYSNQTSFGGLLLTFRHKLQATFTGGTAVTQSLEISGPFCDHIGPKIGSQIAGYFPTAMIKLFGTVGSHSGTQMSFS